MGIINEIKIIQGQLDKIGNLLQTLVLEVENISNKKDKNIKTKEPELDLDEPLLYKCLNCGMSFDKGEEHICKTTNKKK